MCNCLHFHDEIRSSCTTKVAQEKKKEKDFGLSIESNYTMRSPYTYFTSESSYSKSPSPSPEEKERPFRRERNRWKAQEMEQEHKKKNENSHQRKTTIENVRVKLSFLFMSIAFINHSLPFKLPESWFLWQQDYMFFEIDTQPFSPNNQKLLIIWITGYVSELWSNRQICGAILFSVSLDFKYK